MIIDLTNLNNWEREIVYSFSVLPLNYYALPELFEIFQIDKTECAAFFDTIHDLSSKELLIRQKDLYSIREVVRETILETYCPEPEQIATIIDYFSKRLEANQLDYQEEFLPIYNKLKSVIQKVSGNTFHLAQLSYLLSTNLIKYQQYEDALLYNQRAIQISEAIDSKHPIVALFYRDKAYIYKKLGDTVNAIFYSLKDIEILEKHAGKYDDLLPDSYFALSKTYEGIQNYEKAVEYNLKAINFEKKRKRKKSLSISGLYHNLAYCYVKQNKLKDASLFINKAVETFESENHASNKDYKLLLRDQKRFNSLFEFEQFILKYKRLMLVAAGLFLVILIWAVINLLR